MEAAASWQVAARRSAEIHSGFGRDQGAFFSSFFFLRRDGCASTGVLTSGALAAGQTAAMHVPVDD